METKEVGRGGWGLLWREAINLEGAALGPARLGLNRPQPATGTRLNCLIDWPRLQGIFLRPLSADQ